MHMSRSSLSELLIQCQSRYWSSVNHISIKKPNKVINRHSTMNAFNLILLKPTFCYFDSYFSHFQPWLAAGRLDVGDQVVNATYVFTRASPNKWVSSWMLALKVYLLNLSLGIEIRVSLLYSSNIMFHLFIVSSNINIIIYNNIISNIMR